MAQAPWARELVAHKGRMGRTTSGLSCACAEAHRECLYTLLSGRAMRDQDHCINAPQRRMP